MPRVIDYTNYKIGKLTLLYKVRSSRDGNVWKFICDCGKEGEICTTYLYRVKHQSCGCNSAFNNNPRVKNHTLLKAYGAMIKRCTDPQDKNYHNYGGRGVKVCERWLQSYDNFYDDMIDGWQKGLELDKDIIPKSLGIEPNIYCKEYCSWRTRAENSRTRRVSKLNMDKAIEIRLSTKSIREIATKYNIHIETVRQIKKYKIWN